MRAAFLLLVTALGLLSMAVIYGKKLNYPPIRSDGMGYYLYLEAALIDRDLSLTRTVKNHFHGEIPEWAGVNRWPDSDRLVIKYPVGEAIMIAPFFIAAHAIARATGAPADGFSPIYQGAAALAGLTYLVIGLAVLWRLLAESFSPTVTCWTLVFMVFATNLFHYATYDSVMSHAFSFCLFALFLRAVEGWHSRPGAAPTATLAVIAGLITLVRPTNSLVFIYALLYGVVDRESAIGRMRFLRTHIGLVVLGVAVYVLVLSPQCAYWKIATGHWLVFAYKDETFDFAHPEVLNVLVSIRKGVLFWSPVFGLALLGFFWMKRWRPALVLPTLVFVPLNFWVIASWHDWAYGGSFGHRAFIESIVLLAFGYASLLQSASRGMRRTLIAASVTMTALSTWLMVSYWIGTIPFDRTTWPVFLSAFVRG